MRRTRRPSSPMAGYAVGLDLDAAFQLAPVGLAIFDRELRFVHCNEALAQMNGIPVADHIGRRLSDVAPDVAAKVEAYFLSVFETGIPLVDFELTSGRQGSPDTDRTWLESVRPLPDITGRIEHILVSVKEITELKRSEQARETSEEWFRVAQQLSPDGFTIFRAIRDSSGAIVDFEWEYANPAANEMGRAGDLNGRRLLEVFPGNGVHPHLFERYVRLIETGEGDVAEVRYEWEKVEGWYRNSAFPIGQDRIAVKYRDITLRKTLEEQLRTIGAEYRHRLKNAFAVVAAVVTQSAKGAASPEDLSQDILQRLHAMSTAQDILASEGADAGAMGALVSEILTPFACRRLVVEQGPELKLPHGGGIALALALNELATNATKFGALSTDAGQVTVGWRADGVGVQLVWEESGGPAVVPPQHSGFGSRLIRDAARRLPEGEVELDFRQTGLCARFRFVAEG